MVAMSAAPPQRVRVVAIVGAQRTGSTFLATALGMTPGAAMSGELKLLWQSIVEGRPCACLLPVQECPHWRSIVDQVQNESEFPLAELAQRSLLLLRNRQLPHLLRRGSWTRESALRSLVLAGDALYRAFSDAHDGAVVVDSSKSPAQLLLAAHMPNVDLRVVHLVRDPRGVVHSWSKDKVWASGGWSEELRRQPALQATAGWLAMNAASELALGRVPVAAKRRVRFESFTQEPKRVLSELIDFSGLDIPADEKHPVQQRPSGPVVVVQPNHAIAGNVDRFDVGDISVRSDEGWRRSMPAPKRTAIGVATEPLFHRYGYRI